MNIGVYNPSKEIPFNFNLLLHTYFKCPDVRRCQVTGLHGCTFIDKTREPPNSYQVRHFEKFFLSLRYIFLFCFVFIGRPPRGEVGVPCPQAWNSASRPIQTKSCFPRRGQILTPRLPGIEPGPLDLKSGSPAGLSRFELGLPPGGLGLTPPPWRYPINPQYSADPLQAISSL